MSPRSESSSHKPTQPTVPVERVPLLDLGRENGPLEQEMMAAIQHVVQSGRFVLGPEVTQLESRVAKVCGTRHAIGCASGSDALLLALMAVGIEAGDEVIVPSFTFFATASAVYRLGAVPIFADIDPQTFNIDPISVQAAISPKTKAIIPVHLFGQPADTVALREVVGPNLPIIEDAAQAIGASMLGKPAGSLGDIGCFSFYPTKNLGAFGDGGMLTTDSDELADHLRLLRGHGMRPRYYHAEVGVNSRLDTLQAVVLNVKLPHLKAWSQGRAENAKRYEHLFAEAGLLETVQLPSVDSRTEHVWNQYTVRIPGQRDGLREYLAKHNVGSEIYYPVPMHQQECFAGLPAGMPLPETEKAAKEVLSLPVFPTMTIEEQRTVVFRVAEFLAAEGYVAKAA